MQMIKRGMVTVLLAGIFVAVMGWLLRMPEMALAQGPGGIADTFQIGSASDYFVYLPLVSRHEMTACAPIPDVSYGYLSVVDDPAHDPPDSLAPVDDKELNIYVRGFSPAEGYKGLVDYNGGSDSRAPQLYTLFSDLRTPVFSNLYYVDEERDIYDVNMAGMQVQKNEIIHVPDGGYNIGDGNDVLVLYATQNQITLKYTREDNVVYGYTVHIENICTEPSLLALYEQLDAAGRDNLPALQGGEPLGRAWDTEVRVVIRDTGSFMDPRSRKDWWQGR